MPEEPDRLSVATLTWALRERIIAFTKHGDRSICGDEAMALARELRQLTSTASDDDVALESLLVIAWLHWCRYLAMPAGHDMEDFDAAVALFRVVAKADVGLVPEALRPRLVGSDHSAAQRTEKALAMLRSIESGGDMAVLDGAVDLLREATLSAAVLPPDRPTYLSHLGVALGMRFGRRGSMADLDEAISVMRAAVAGSPVDRPERAAYLANLGSALRVRFQRTRNLANLEEAVTTGRAAVEALQLDDSDRAACLSNLSASLLARHENLGDSSDLDEAIETSRMAIQSLPIDHPDQAGYLSNLGLALRTRFHRFGRLADLDQAIRIGRDALTATPADHPERAVYLSNLGAALTARYEHRRELTDLDEALEIARQAVAAVSDSDPDQARYLSNLALGLRTRFHRFGHLADLDEAVRIGRDALTATSADHPERAAYLSNLSAALILRYEQSGKPADLDEAITAGRTAVEATTVAHPDQTGYLSNLGQSLLSRFKRTSDVADLQEAVAAFSTAVEATPVDHPRRAIRLSNLATAYTARFTATNETADAESATIAWQDAATTVTASPALRVAAALQWGGLAASIGHWSDALAGYETAVVMLPKLAWRGVSREDQQRLLADRSGVAADAAACAINAGQYLRALALLEHGRGVLWSQLLETQTDLADLHRTAPHLAQHLHDLRIAFDASDSSAVDDRTEPDARSSHDVDLRMALAREWDEAVEQVRQLEGFEDFLRPPHAETLLQAAADGPVVIINVSRWRCDALVVTTHGVDIVDLPDLTRNDVVSQVNLYLQAVQQFGWKLSDIYEARHDHDAGRVMSQYRSIRGGMEEQLRETLRWMWDAFVSRLLDHLGFSAQPVDRRWPRLWWCPTGPLTVLPLHAAGHHESGDDAVLDRVISSYTPTVRALLKARSVDQAQSEEPKHDSSMLMVAVPETLDRPSLLHVTRERNLLAMLFQGSTFLEDGAATRSAVLSALPQHRWVHFSCHGDQNLADPSRGGLELYDGRLTITDLRSRQYRGDLAFLSACHTATGGISLPDEAITLAAALHYTGYRHVIATLWAVWDDTAADVTEWVYGELADSGGLRPERAAFALHNAVRRLRDRSDHPSVWTPFAHTGP